jgi:hypothetical protein
MHQGLLCDDGDRQTVPPILAKDSGHSGRLFNGVTINVRFSGGA